MASRTITQLVSDLSGDEIPDGGGETIEFSYRGTSYSIDLTAKEAAGFDKSIAMYIEHATKRGTARSRSKASKPRSSVDARDIRAWAKDQGIDVPDRGRIPGDVRAQYESATH